AWVPARHPRLRRPLRPRRSAGPRLQPRRRGLAHRLRAATARDAAGGRAGNRAWARAGTEEGRGLLPGLDVGGVRRSPRASAEGVVLGKREPGGPALGVRRVEALRRGAG